MIDGRNFFDQPFKNDIKTYDNIRKIARGHDDDYTQQDVYQTISISENTIN